VWIIPAGVWIIAEFALVVCPLGCGDGWRLWEWLGLKKAWEVAGGWVDLLGVGWWGVRLWGFKELRNKDLWAGGGVVERFCRWGALVFWV
jgi:hypothetical protein